MYRVKLTVASLFILFFAFCLYQKLTAPRPVSAHSSGPWAGYTGAPDESLCLFCHRSFPADDPSGGLLFDGLPETYTPGEPLEFSVTVFQDGTPEVRKNWGFELTVLDRDNKFVGALVASDTINTKIIPDTDPERGRTYIEQTLAGSFFNPQGSDMATWTMTWIPPDDDVGAVTFYAAGNAGNGDETPGGDFIFTKMQVVNGPEPKKAAGMWAPPYK